MLRKRHLLAAAALAGTVAIAGTAFAFGPGYGYGPGYGWQQGPFPGGAVAPGYGPGMRGGRHGGWGSYAAPVAPWAADGNVTVDEIKQLLTWQMQRRNNPNLKLGKVEAKDDATIVAEIVTKDDSLVSRIEVDRKTGFFRFAQ